MPVPPDPEPDPAAGPARAPSSTLALACLFAAAALSLPALALAHPGALAEHLGEPHGFADGFLHPFTGVDHLGAMLAVGIWTAGNPRRRLFAPAAFAACLLAGALITLHGVVIPAVEPMIGFSLLVFGLPLAHRTSMPPALAAILVGGFALFHGAAHGAELGSAAALAGLVAATLVLHAAGIVAGLALRRHDPWWTRIAGIVLALSGVSMMTA